VNDPAVLGGLLRLVVAVVIAALALWTYQQ
jgi:hypothetical protein